MSFDFPFQNGATQSSGTMAKTILGMGEAAFSSSIYSRVTMLNEFKVRRPTLRNLRNIGLQGFKFSIRIFSDSL